MVQKKVPQRMCIACRVMKDKRDLIRIVRTPDGEIIIDRTGKKPGRGCYICNCHQCLEKVIKSHGLEKSFSMKIDKDVYDSLREELNDE